MSGVTGEQDWYVSGVFNMSFLNLNDTFGDYIGRANNMLKVNSTEDAITVIDGTFEDHNARHENAGADEISVAGLSGVLANEQNPVNHVADHEAGGIDELGCLGNNTNQVIRLTNPAGAADTWSTSSEIGAIQINLPAVEGDMIYFKATVYNYVDQTSFDVIVFGFLYVAALSWVHATAIIIGDNPIVKRVRFCRNADSSQYYVIIGDTTTSWAYPWIAITDFVAGYTPAISDWNDNWSFSLITSIPSYTDYDFTDARVSPKEHSVRHADGGEDELNVTNLTGVLADKQDPQNHASRHSDGGIDQLDAEDLSGDKGAIGNVLKTDGNTAYWGGISVGTGALKTSLGSVSNTSPGGVNLTLPGGLYSFYPQVKGFTDRFYIGYNVPNSSYRTNIYLFYDNSFAYARVRYVTASGEIYWVFVLRDKQTKSIMSIYQAPDHPCFGNSGDPDIVSHPFPDFDSSNQEIIVINPEISFMKQIRDRTPKNKDLLETLLGDYEIDESKSVPWTEKEITVDVEHNDFPFDEPGKACVVKKKIPKPGHIKTASFKERKQKWTSHPNI